MVLWGSDGTLGSGPYVERFRSLELILEEDIGTLAPSYPTSQLL